MLTGNVPWGDAALAVVRDVLARPANGRLRLYLFRALVPSKTVQLRLDDLDDVYGSPDVDDIERVSREVAAGLEEALGPAAAGEIGLEVSSPGAERQLVLPGDLERFKVRQGVRAGARALDACVACVRALDGMSVRSVHAHACVLVRARNTMAAAPAALHAACPRKQQRISSDAALATLLAAPEPPCAGPADAR